MHFGGHDFAGDAVGDNPVESALEVQEPVADLVCGVPRVLLVCTGTAQLQEGKKDGGTGARPTGEGREGGGARAGLGTHWSSGLPRTVCRCGSWQHRIAALPDICDDGVRDLASHPRPQ